MKQYIRAVARLTIALGALPAVVGLAAVQGFVVGPLTGNRTLLPNMVYRSMRKLFGYKIEFNAASAPVVKDKQVWFVANHMSNADFVILGSKFNGTFVGKGDILKWPLVAQMARAAKYIGLRRSAEFNDQSRAKIIKNFNQGFNTIMFPEGTTSDGKKVSLFRAAMLTILYGEKGMDKKKKEVVLQKDVVVQPIALRVKAVEGKNAIGNDDLRNMYSMQGKHSMLSELWKRVQIRDITIELTAFPPLNPKDYGDAMALINTAATEIASVVNPGQTTFEKAVIPGTKPKPC